MAIKDEDGPALGDEMIAVLQGLVDALRPGEPLETRSGRLGRDPVPEQLPHNPGSVATQTLPLDPLGTAQAP